VVRAHAYEAPSRRWYCSCPTSSSAGSARIDVVTLGEPLVEFNQTAPGETCWLQGFGGDTSNAAIAAARSGARAACVSRVGDDVFGRKLFALWRAEGVDARAVRVDPGAPTGIYFVTHGPAGHEFTYRRAGSAASRLSRADLPRELLRAARFVHASGISLAISESAAQAALEAYAAAGGRRSFDANLRLRLWPLERARTRIGEASALADLLFLSVDEARTLSGLEREEAVLDWAHGLGAKAVFLKLGAEGVWVSDGATRERIAGHAVRAVDATGAGDCFCGAALARLAAGDSIWEAARYANAAAALATTGYGAVAPLPRPEAVRRLLASSA
jgi:2-dehydro-3-deoxygluconokinase